MSDEGGGKTPQIFPKEIDREDWRGLIALALSVGYVIVMLPLAVMQNTLAMATVSAGMLPLISSIAKEYFDSRSEKQGEGKKKKGRV